MQVSTECEISADYIFLPKDIPYLCGCPSEKIL